MNAEDLFWLAVNAYHEARGECDEGIQGVCHVVLNRCKRRRMTIKQVVLQPWQFSWANNGKRPPISEYEAFHRCLSLAERTMEEREMGIDFGGADHYYADYIKMPSWAGDFERVAKVGKHIFYRS